MVASSLTMMLDSLEKAVLIAIDRVTKETRRPTEADAVYEELGRMGQMPTNTLFLYDLAIQMRDDGYIDAYFGGGMAVGQLKLTREGRELARRDIDPMERIYTEVRRFFGSDQFASAYPDVFQLWASAERLLFSDDVESELTAIGHKVREAAQAFATATLARYGGDAPPDDVKAVKRRLGAVIARHRLRFGEKRRKVLEALGDLWEASVDLIERQEHAAQKEGEPVTWHDARRVVSLTMYLIVEFSTILDELPDLPVATLEGAGGVSSTAFLNRALLREAQERRI